MCLILGIVIPPPVFRECTAGLTGFARALYSRAMFRHAAQAVVVIVAGVLCPLEAPAA
jgi:hypothetical protein